ncbi:N-acetyltransferase family protein [uncultured Cohaesibacter sp.]|uniref:GNAT family N-acetyltransferase n=1 Tax=uncultured Cohaesibacter sp. TaxID=1002546 RepID=UPI002AA954BB|nr:N-acetyltransferase family protein [uncultured Cohaesibacter sp.]
MIIRDAEIDDAENINRIHNEAVTNSTAIWTNFSTCVAERRNFIESQQAENLPLIVAINDDGILLGYASFGKWKQKEGYRFTVENSIYVDAMFRGRGIGTKLLEALVERARQSDVHAMIAAIEASNASSIRLHQKLGFNRVGLLPQVGTKFGKWLDLAYLQLTLDEREEA